jgi:outer membrane lipoprotein-sorting protein
VWKAGDDRSRVAVDAPFAEFDVVRDGTDVWTFDSASSDVTHLVLPEDAQAEPAPVPSGTATPQDVAETLLSYVEPTTTVTVGRAEEVAGRAAYELVLEPKDEGTLVDEVRLAVDGETSVPLRVQAFGVGQAEPAVEVGFTSVRFAVPDESVFDFTPPSGSTVTERSLEDLGAAKDGTTTAPETTDPGTTAPETTGPPPALPQVVGSGWTTVVETAGVRLPEEAQTLFGQLSTPVEGGRTITSALLSVLLTDDGRLLVGSVPPERLVELAGR